MTDNGVVNLNLVFLTFAPQHYVFILQGCPPSNCLFTGLWPPRNHKLLETVIVSYSSLNPHGPLWISILQCLARNRYVNYICVIGEK